MQLFRVVYIHRDEQHDEQNDKHEEHWEFLMRKAFWWVLDLLVDLLVDDRFDDEMSTFFPDGDVLMSVSKRNKMMSEMMNEMMSEMMNEMMSKTMMSSTSSRWARVQDEEY